MGASNCCQPEESQAATVEGLLDIRPAVAVDEVLSADAASKILEEGAAKQTLEPEPAAAEPALEPKSSAKSICIEFNDAGAVKTVEIAEVPLGVTFRNVSPLVVKKIEPNGSGGKAGVQEGWVFTKVGDESLDGMDYIAAVSALKRGLQGLPVASGQEYFQPGAFVIEFDTGSGAKKVAFTKQPLGFTYGDSVPVVVSDVTEGGQAQQLGIKQGWSVKAIGTNSVSCDNLSFALISDLLTRGQSGLPSE